VLQELAHGEVPADARLPGSEVADGRIAGEGRRRALSAVLWNGAGSNTVAGRSNHTAITEASPPPRLCPVKLMLLPAASTPWVRSTLAYTAAACLNCDEEAPRNPAAFVLPSPVVSMPMAPSVPRYEMTTSLVAVLRKTR